MVKRRAKQYPPGTRPHGNGIEIKFIWPKEAKTYAYKTLDWQPSPINLERAGKLRQSIVDAIKHDAFKWADFFPDDYRATERQGGTFAHYAQSWLNSPQNDWKPQTRYKFKNLLNQIWMPHIHDKPIRACTYTVLLDVLAAVTAAHKEANGKEPGKSTYNDWLTCLRGVFDMAVRDGAIPRASNPAMDFKNKTRDRTEPDPFDREEFEAIIADIYKHDGDMWGAWFELGFFTGMRYPSEPAALLWRNVDLKRNEVQVTQIYSKHAAGGIQATTKTGVARTVHLNSRARHALVVARELTGFGEYVFTQANGPVKSGEPQRAMWRASLKRLGIRHRDAYNVRHTYATFCIMNGAKPAFVARQLGNSMAELFKTYAKWIGRFDDKSEMDKIEEGIAKNCALVAKTWREK